MSGFARIILIIALAVTMAAIITWRVTGGDYYTKFKIIKQVEQAVDQNDPLAHTGFYDDQKSNVTVEINQFRLGLLPAPAGLFDRHIISVMTILAPIWIIAIVLIWLNKRGIRARP